MKKRIVIEKRGGNELKYKSNLLVLILPKISGTAITYS